MLRTGAAQQLINRLASLEEHLLELQTLRQRLFQDLRNELQRKAIFAWRASRNASHRILRYEDSKEIEPAGAVADLVHAEQVEDGRSALIAGNGMARR